MNILAHVYSTHLCVYEQYIYKLLSSSSKSLHVRCHTQSKCAVLHLNPPPPILFQRSEFVHINIRVCMLAPCLSLSHFSFSTLLLSSPLIFPLPLSSSLALSFYY